MRLQFGKPTAAPAYDGFMLLVAAAADVAVGTMRRYSRWARGPCSTPFNTIPYHLYLGRLMEVHNSDKADRQGSRTGVKGTGARLVGAHQISNDKSTYHYHCGRPLRTLKAHACHSIVVAFGGNDFQQNKPVSMFITDLTAALPRSEKLVGKRQPNHLRRRTICTGKLGGLVWGLWRGADNRVAPVHKASEHARTEGAPYFWLMISTLVSTT